MPQQVSSVKWCHPGQRSLAPVTRVQTRLGSSSRSCRTASAPKQCKRFSTWSTATVNSWSNSSIAAYISTVINCPTSTMEHLPLSARPQGRHRSIRSSHTACFYKSTSSNYRHNLTITIRTIWSSHNHKNNKKAHPPNLCLKTRQAQLTTTKDRGHRQVMPSNPHHSIPRFNSREIIRQSHQM